MQTPTLRPWLSLSDDGNVLLCPTTLTVMAKDPVSRMELVLSPSIPGHVRYEGHLVWLATGSSRHDDVRENDAHDQREILAQVERLLARFPPGIPDTPLRLVREHERAGHYKHHANHWDLDVFMNGAMWRLMCETSPEIPTTRGFPTVAYTLVHWEQHSPRPNPPCEGTILRYPTFSSKNECEMHTVCVHDGVVDCHDGQRWAREVARTSPSIVVVPVNDDDALWEVRRVVRPHATSTTTLAGVPTYVMPSTHQGRPRPFVAVSPTNARPEPRVKSDVRVAPTSTPVETFVRRGLSRGLDPLQEVLDSLDGALVERFEARWDWNVVVDAKSRRVMGVYEDDARLTWFFADGRILEATPDRVVVMDASRPTSVVEV